MTTESCIIANKGGSTSFVGTDAVRLYQATVLASELRLYAKCGMKPNRAWTPTAMLKTAASITGKHYKRGEYLKAADDLTAWGDTMNAALPHVNNEERTA